MIKKALITAALSLPSLANATPKIEPARIVFQSFNMQRPLPGEFGVQYPTGVEFDILIVMQEKKFILEFDPTEAVLKSLEGQLGTNMMPTGKWIKRSTISKDHRQLYLRIGTPTLPKKGARHFSIEATAPVLTGARFLNAEVKSLDMTTSVPWKKEGGVIQEIRVQRAGVYTKLELLMNIRNSQLGQMTFRDVNNTVLSTERLETRPGANNQQTWFVYKVHSDSTKMSILATYFGEVLRQFVPIKMKIPVWF